MNNNQEKGFVVALMKNEWGGNSYHLGAIEKIVDDVVVTEGPNYLKDLKRMSNMKIFNASNMDNFFVELINSDITPNAKVPIIPEMYSIPYEDCIVIKIGPSVLGTILGNKMMTEEEFVCKLYNFFVNIQYLDFEERDKSSVGRHEGKYCAVAHMLPEIKNFIEPTDDIVKSIVTPGRIKAENNGSSIKNKTQTSATKVPVKKSNNSSISDLNQDEIITKIKKKIIAQDKVIQDVVDTIFLNQELISLDDPDLLNTSKANILIDGPTGTGKTFLLKEISSHMNLPLVISSATSFSTTGYKGSDLESLLIKLLDEASGDLALAEKGIIVIDEFDKLGTSNKDDELAMRKGIQEELLSYLSGAKFIIKYKGEDIEFDTSKITFVAMGAFTNLRERKIKEKEEKGNKIGFGEIFEKSNDGRTYTIEPEDYISEGIMREFIGRFTTITHTNALTKEDLVKLMKESATSPLLATKKIVAMHGKELIVNDEVLEYIADIVLQMNTGARGLQTIFNPINRALLRDIKSKDIPNIEITMDLINSLQEDKVRRY